MAPQRPKIYARLKGPRAAAIAGILFAILLFISLILLLTFLPEKPPENGGWVVAQRSNLLLSLNLIPFAGLMFIWFMAVLRDFLGENEDQFFLPYFWAVDFSFWPHFSLQRGH